MSTDLEALSREIAETSDAVRLAIAAVKANPPLNPLPWREDDSVVRSASSNAVAQWAEWADAAHIAAAVNAAPVLIAEVERLQAVVEAERQAALVIAAACLDTGLVPQGASGTVDAVRAVCGHVVGLQAALAAARVAVERWPELDCASWCSDLRCTCGAEDQNLARATARRALGLEVGNG